MNQRDKIGYQQGIVSIIVNILLFILKYWAGIVSGSIAIIADAWHTLSDSLSSVIVIGGVKLASKNQLKNILSGMADGNKLPLFLLHFYWPSSLMSSSVNQS